MTVRAGAALLFALLTLPFDASWPDFEVARRGALLIAVGLLAALGPRWCPPLGPRGGLLLAGACAWLLVRAIGVTNPLEALHHAAHWAALAVAFWFGATSTTRGLSRAVLPVVAVVAGYGILQACGIDWPAGYARPSEPVSTLGNRNVASELVAFGAAVAGLHVARGRRPLAAVAIAWLAAAYLGVNGSRSGLSAIAVALACTSIGVASDRRRLRVVLLGATLGVAALAWALRPGPTSAAPAAPSAAGSVDPTPSTLAVRTHLWRACVRMIADAPLAGHGTGQFRYEYPRYRSEAEIELSSFGRRFPTFAASAHNDPLELAVEAGLPAALALIAFAWVALRSRRARADLAELAPLVAFAALALVRSPLGNAPVAAAAFAWLGALAARAAPSTSARPRRGALSWSIALVCGGAMLWLGTGILLGEVHAAAYLRSLQNGRPDLAAIDRAVDAHGSESRLRSLRIGARRVTSNDADAYARSIDDLTAIARLDPNNTNALLVTAELAHAAGNATAARAALARIGALDPREPRAVLLAAVLEVESGDVATAIARLYADPHPRLREGLAQHLDDLSRAPELQRDPRGQARLMREAAFVRALDALLADPTSDATGRALAACREMLGDRELRVAVLVARRLQAIGDAPAAAALAPAEPLAEPLSRSMRRLLQPALEALAGLDAWRRTGLLDG